MKFHVAKLLKVILLFALSVYIVYGEDTCTTMDGGKWKYLGVFNSVSTYSQQIYGTSLMAMKGIGVLDGVHISEAIGSYMDTNTHVDWVDMLQNIKVVQSSIAQAPEFRLGGFWRSVKEVVYQKYVLPWPIAPREFVLERVFEFNGNDGLTNDLELDHLKQIGVLEKGAMNAKTLKLSSVLVKHHSIDDSRFPTGDGAIRGESKFTNWKFTNISPLVNSDDPKKVATLIQVESFVDNKGSLPARLVNYMLRSWPEKSINSFGKIAAKKRSKPYEPISQW